ncbi:MAG: hypothetical protein RIM80_06125 [Alphaproteobacteria bacterium]
MAELPVPEPGLVIRYRYLWADERRRGQEAGVKPRPCAIILALTQDAGRIRTAVVPITHLPPGPGAAAVELPPAVKRRLGLDAARSWAIVDEANVFVWPGADLEAVPGAKPVTVA